MLGEQIIPDEQGKVIGIRVLPSGEAMPQMEITFQSTGTVLGIGFNNTGTVISTARLGGGFIDEGRGVFMTADGEMGSWTYQGVGQPTGRGMAGTHRGIVLFQTASQKLARLNSLCAVVAADIDEEGTMKAALWEWK